MTKQKIQQEIETILLRMGIAPKAITKQASYTKDLGLDSLDFAELMMEFECHLGLRINCEAMEELKTINDTIEYLSQLKIRATK